MKKLHFVSLLALASPSLFGALIVNSAIPITHTLTVQPIIVSTSDNSETATYLGTAAQQTEILGHIDTIWAQAGIDVEFLVTNTYSNDFAFDGRPDDHSNGSGNPRPITDINEIFNTAGTPPLNSDTSVLNMFFLDIVPGFEFTSENTANGLAYIDFNGVTQFAGDNLLSFSLGREVIASVIAHEIGHNLGLEHLVEAENLLQEGGSQNQGERISSDQIDTIFTDDVGLDGFDLLVAIPEPTSSVLLVLSFVGFTFQRRR